MKFRKKPVVVEAVQWNGSNFSEINSIGGERVLSRDLFDDSKLVIETLEGDMAAQKGDWIIKGVKGELYPCKPDIFESTYEAI